MKRYRGTLRVVSYSGDQHFTNNWVLEEDHDREIEQWKNAIADVSRDYYREMDRQEKAASEAKFYRKTNVKLIGYHQTERRKRKAAEAELAELKAENNALKRSLEASNIGLQEAEADNARQLADQRTIAEQHYARAEKAEAEVARLNRAVATLQVDVKEEREMARLRLKKIERLGASVERLKEGHSSVNETDVWADRARRAEADNARLRDGIQTLILKWSSSTIGQQEFSAVTAILKELQALRERSER